MVAREICLRRKTWRWVFERIPSRPVDLAVFRMVVVANVLVSPDLRDALATGSTGPFVPIAFAIAMVAGLAALVGFRTNLSCFALCALALYLFGVSQRSGTVTHTHHLVWFLALLAAGPSGAALSVDRALAARSAARSRRRPPRDRRSVAIALVFVAAWTLVGIIFFFPGCWKLFGGRGAWLDGSAVVSHLHWKWFEMGGWTPGVRIDRQPLACRLGGIATVVFEISFGFAIFVERLRKWAIVAAITFHVMTAAFMRVYFSSLWTCYVMFVDWDLVLRSAGRLVSPNGVSVEYDEDGGPRHVRCAVLRSLDVLGIGNWTANRTSHDRSDSTPRGPSHHRPAKGARILATGMVLVVPNLVYGTLGITQAWPFACYPTFHRAPDRVAPGLVLEAIRADGTSKVVPHGPDLSPDRRQHAWGIVFSLLGANGRDIDPERIRDYALRTLEDPRAKKQAAGANRLRVYRVWYSTEPERYGEIPTGKELLVEMDLFD